MRRLVNVVIAIVILIIINFTIYQQEQLLAQGTTLLLELAPRDPRSLIQGDYMVLRYKIANEPQLWNVEQDGWLVVERDDNHLAQFKRIYNQTVPLQPNEMLLRFRKRQHGIRLGAESFFFQEGHAHYYENARYGELKVAKSGKGILVGLRDDHFKPLQAPPSDLTDE
jgi:uncharacterized membrane-anchored protein